MNSNQPHETPSGAKVSPDRGATGRGATDRGDPGSGGELSGRERDAAGAAAHVAGTTTLRPVLGWFSAGAIVVGGVIGSGIFLKPKEVAEGTDGHLGLILTLWLVCGLVNLCGALTLGELSAMMPHAGGTYVFLREGYGRLVAFLWAWAEFWVIRSASIAALGVAMTMTLKELLDTTPWAVAPGSEGLFLKSVSVTTIVFLAAVNVLGTRHGGTVQNLTTIVKAAFVAFLALLPLLAFFQGTSAPAEAAAQPSPWPREWTASLAVGIGGALAGIMWAYDGWGNVTVVAEEIHHPQRNVPLALVGGLVLLIVLYLAATLGCHLFLPTETIKQEDNPFSVMMYECYGAAGANVLLVMLVISIFGALNSNILIGPRVLYAVARDLPGLARFSRIDPRTGTPLLAIVTLSAWSVVLIVVADVTKQRGERLFDVLTDLCIFGGSLFYLAAVAAVFLLRRRRPDAERPYRTWGYPLVPVVFVLFYVVLIAALFVKQPLGSLAGIGLISTGAVAYLGLARERTPA